MTTTRLEITRPDDWHLHLRDGATLGSVLGHTAQRFARAIVMPNLKPPVTTVAQAEAYRERILAALPAGADFQRHQRLVGVGAWGQVAGHLAEAEERKK